MARRLFGAFALVTALALVLSACGSKTTSVGSSSEPTTTTGSGPVLLGGTVVIGAEQEPDCLDWLGQCAGSLWGSWLAQYETLPMAFRTVVKNGDIVAVPGSVLAGMPTFVASPIETITYDINPAAKWSDNVAITCADFQYTAAQQQSGPDIYDRTGYVDIDKVSCPNDKTVVVTYKKGKTYAGWQSLFAGAIGVLPAHILKGKDRDKLMKDGYSWSGGPWFAKWNKGTSIVLTPNPNYWGAEAHLDKVVFEFQRDTAAEFQAYQSGQVDAIYPQPQVDVVDAIKQGLPGSHTAYHSQTASVESLWFNNARFPFDSQAVRQAVGYAIDRSAIVSKLFGALGVTAPSNSPNASVIKDYSDPNAWAGYKLDLTKVTSLMTGAGWAKGSDGIWAKSGKRAAFTIVTNADNQRRVLTEQVMQPELTAAGFDVTIKNTSADNLFGVMLPAGNYQASVYGGTLTGITPGLCSEFCTENIPGPANQNSGQNWSWVSVPAADAQMRIVDTSLDDHARRVAGAKADDLLAEADVTLPIDPLPDILVWNDKVVGPVSDNPIEGMFWNIDQWGIKH
jgi:peptide/nickel transport system substrate-binding protein